MNTKDQAADGEISRWYSDADENSSSSELLQSTITHAKQLLHRILKPQDYALLFPPPSSSSSSSSAQDRCSHTIADVQRSLAEAQAAYECRVGRASSDPFGTVAPASASATPLGRSKAKVRVWLTGLSEKLVYYGNIFDVLVQQHPEYVSLAWGTFKLLFTAITNHAETSSKLSKSISQIADLLPQHSLHLILYPTPQMQTHVARLFAHILNFFLSALKWYHDRRAAHALQAVFQPWDLKFRHGYEAILAEAQHIGRLAEGALKAEMRHTRLQVVQGGRHWEVVREEMDGLRADNRRLADLVREKFGIMEGSMSSMYKEIRIDLTSQRATLNRVHLTQMLSLPLWSPLPTSGDSLRFCRSIRNRRRERTKLPLPDVQKLDSWASQPNTALLLIDTCMPVVAKNFMVDLIDLILDSRLPIIWALRYADYWEQPVSGTDLVRMLVLQTMQVGADRLLETPFPVTVEQLRDAAHLRDWVAILNHLLRSLSHAFIVLDPDLLAHATAHERSAALEILDVLRSELAGRVKIVTAASSVSRAYAAELERLDACVRIWTGGQGDWRKSRRLARSMLRVRKRDGVRFRDNDGARAGA